ncbi:MAG: peptidase S10 [Phycisphaerae bacterium]
MRRYIVALALILASLPAGVWAQNDNYRGPLGAASPEPATRPADEGADSRSLLGVEGAIEDASITRHELTAGGETLSYEATAAHMLMKDEEGKLKARIFFMAYLLNRSDNADPADRPVTFVFNGGPGAASVWLHLGTAGPRRIDLNHEGEPPAPPYRLVENRHSWLDATDLVFIDPVGTGYSRPGKGEKGEQFYGVQQDIASVADFIRLWITQYRRWASPLFLAGESYGTTRAAGLSEHLLDRHGIALNGIMLISTVLDFGTLQPGNGNDLPYVLFLPTYTATAFHHGKLGKGLQQDLGRTLREVQHFAVGEYATALIRGAAMSPEQRAAVVQSLARYTSLAPEFIDRADLRIAPGVFQKQLLSDQRRIIGRFDTRITGFEPDPIASRPEYDPSLSRYLPVYSANFNDYVRRVLGFRSDLPYEVLSSKVHPWKFGESGAGYLFVADDLRSALIKNPHMKVLFASGYFDLATPFFATVHTIDHLDVGPELRANIVEKYYLGGHMMYHHQPTLARLHEDIVSFIRVALPGSGS